MEQIFFTNKWIERMSSFKVGYEISIIYFTNIINEYKWDYKDKIETAVFTNLCKVPYPSFDEE